jgi:hypothetical protein
MRFILLLMVVVGLASCDPIKRAAKRQKAFDEALAQYLRDNPIPADTFYLPGQEIHHWDTIVNENIYIDTVHSNDTTYLTKTRWIDVIKTTKVLDTIWIRSFDQSALNRANDQVLVSRSKLDESNKLNRGLGIGIGILGILLIASIGIRFK